MAWVVPILGVLAAGATWLGQDRAQPLLRERVLAGVAFVLSIGNGVGLMLSGT